MLRKLFNKIILPALILPVLYITTTLFAADLSANDKLKATDVSTPLTVFEQPYPNERQIIQEMIQLIKASVDKRYAAQPMQRFNQSKSVACLKASFQIPDLEPDLRIGAFKVAGTYKTWLRFANATAQNDADKDFQGLSLKIFGIPGENLSGTGKAVDFVLNSHPVLFVGHLENFKKFIDASMNSHPLFFFLNPLDLHWKEFRIVLAGRQNPTSHLAIPYWSTTPYLFGAKQAAKYGVFPCQTPTAKLPEKLTENYLREALQSQLKSEGACFDFMVQLQTNPATMPIEDATSAWDTQQSPMRKVAKILIPPQKFDHPQQMEFCEDLAFNPWNTLVEHQPLGNINRGRKEIYQNLADYRHQKKGRPITEANGDEVF